MGILARMRREAVLRLLRWTARRPCARASVNVLTAQLKTGQSVVLLQAVCPCHGGDIVLSEAVFVPERAAQLGRALTEVAEQLDDADVVEC